jgi:hypothetical protein
VKYEASAGPEQAPLVRASLGRAIRGGLVGVGLGLLFGPLLGAFHLGTGTAKSLLAGMAAGATYFAVLFGIGLATPTEHTVGSSRFRALVLSALAGALAGVAWGSLASEPNRIWHAAAIGLLLGATLPLLEISAASRG